MAYFSVIIPAFNAESFVTEALDSVKRQGFSDFEILVVNDGSTDNTGRLVELWRDANSQFDLKIRHQSNKKLGAARNAAIELSSGEFIAFLDADDQWASNKLQAIAGLLSEHPDIDVVCHDEWLVRKGKKVELRRCGPFTSYEDLLFKGNCLSPSATVARTSCLRAVNAFSQADDVHGAEDYDMWLKLSKNGSRFQYLHQPLGFYRIHDGMLSGRIHEHSRNGLKVLENHFNDWEPQNAYYLRMMRKRRAITLAGCSHQLIRQGKHKEAFRFILSTVITYPFAWKSYVLLVLNTYHLLTQLFHTRTH